MQPSLKNIILSTDFSAAADNALNSAIALCQQHNSALTLVHVIDDSRIHFTEERKIVFGPVQQLVRIASENLNLLAIAIATNHNISVSFKVLTGKPAHEICRFAREKQIDLIVIAKRGEFNHVSLRVGDIAAQVVKLSCRPVLCIPHGRLYTKFRKTLFPVQEFSPVMAHYKLAKLLCSNSRPLFVVAGIGKRNVIGLTPTRLIRLTELLAQKIIHDGLQLRRLFNVCDDVPSEVVNISNNEETDLIFASPSGAKEIHLHKNDNALDILTRSSCPVLTVGSRFMAQLN